MDLAQVPPLLDGKRTAHQEQETGRKFEYPVLRCGSLVVECMLVTHEDRGSNPRHTAKFKIWVGCRVWLLLRIVNPVPFGDT